MGGGGLGVILPHIIAAEDMAVISERFGGAMGRVVTHYVGTRCNYAQNAQIRLPIRGQRAKKQRLRLWVSGPSKRLMFGDPPRGRTENLLIKSYLISMFRRGDTCCSIRALRLNQAI